MPGSGTNASGRPVSTRPAGGRIAPLLRSPTDLDAEVNRSRRGSEPISAEGASAGRDAP